MQAGDKSIAYRRKSVAERQRELIDAGIACLGEGGMSGFTIDRIRRRAGVSRGLINHYFRSKDDLLLAIYAQMTEHLLADRQPRRPPDYLREIIDINFDERTFNASNLRAWLAVWGEIAGNRALFDLHRRRYEGYQSRIAAALGELGAAQGLDFEPRQLARQLIALIDGLWLEYCLHPDEFTLAAARQDCYDLLRAKGISL